MPPPHLLVPPLPMLARLLWLTIIAVSVTACALRPYEPVSVGDSDFLRRAKTQQQGDLRVTAAVPDAEETRALTNLALYDQGVQPVWLEVENKTAENVRVALWSIDRDYFSPIEVAYTNRKKFSRQGYRDMERWFHDNALPRVIPAGEKRSGLVFTHFKPGTKGFNIDVFSNTNPTTFTFFMPIPGFEADYTEVDFAGMYDAAEIRRLSVPELRMALETDLGCCVTDSSGKLDGGPLNTVLVGSPLAVRRSLLRGDWTETRRAEMDERGLRQQMYRGRSADAIVTLDRKDGDEQLILQLWLTPWVADSEQVWIGQVYYTTLDQKWLGELTGAAYARDSSFLSNFASESPSADVDSALTFLVQNFWYNQSVRQWGVVDGVGRSTVENPHATFRGDAFFTRGKRSVLFLSETPVALDEGRIIFDNPLARDNKATSDE